MDHKKKADREAGFTVTEVLVALVVMTIGIAATLGLYTKLVKGNASVARLSQAKAVAEQLLEELTTIEVAIIETLPPRPPVVRKNTSYQSIVTVDAVAGSPNLARVTVQVQYTEDGDEIPHQVRLQQLRSRLPVL